MKDGWPLSCKASQRSSAGWMVGRPGPPFNQRWFSVVWLVAVPANMIKSFLVSRVVFSGICWLLAYPLGSYSTGRIVWKFAELGIPHLIIALLKHPLAINWRSKLMWEGRFSDVIISKISSRHILQSLATVIFFEKSTHLNAFQPEVSISRNCFHLNISSVTVLYHAE